MSNYVQAQKLNQRLTLQRLVPARDDWGQPQHEQWEDVFDFWGHIKTISGSGFVSQEFVAGGSEVSRATASIRTRKRDSATRNFDAGMRVIKRAGNRLVAIYEIRVVLPDMQDNRYVDLSVANGASNG